MIDLFFDTITARIASTAWRHSLVAKFPDDSRNLPAAEQLEQLADDASDVLPATWAKLDLEHPRFTQALNDCCRDVGFRSKPKNLNHFILTVAERLADRGVQ